ncbi:hypothetical protein DL771_008092 [Monosporascus sp. 5C6A]|nr:hypothetical protein DL771_008092 [Monosporascus sp. 5C6A]
MGASATNPASLFAHGIKGYTMFYTMSDTVAACFADVLWGLDRFSRSLCVGRYRFGVEIAEASFQTSMQLGLRGFNRLAMAAEWSAEFMHDMKEKGY